MSLNEYLAKNYLTADPKPEKKSKKRKRRQEGLIIADDDDTSVWNRRDTIKDDEDGPVTGWYGLRSLAVFHVLTSLSQSRTLAPHSAKLRHHNGRPSVPPLHHQQTKLQPTPSSSPPPRRPLPGNSSTTKKTAQSSLNQAIRPLYRRWIPAPTPAYNPP